MKNTWLCACSSIILLCLKSCIVRGGGGGGGEEAKFQILEKNPQVHLIIRE